MTTKLWTLVVVSFSFVGISVCLSSNFSAEHRLHEKLFQTGYNRHARPIADSSKPVEVELTFELFGIYNIDEIGLTMQTTGFILAKWVDEQLKWDKDDYGGLEHVVMWPDQVWLPDMGLQNSADTFYHITFHRDFRVNIRYDGLVTWAFGGIFATSCSLDMFYYPLDKQNCDIIFENWQYHSDGVKLKHSSEGMVKSAHDFSENGIWALDHYKAASEEFTDPLTPGYKYPRVTFSVFMSRKPRFYAINIMLPSFFLFIIALLVFWTTPDSGEKISLSVTVLLSFAVFQVVIMESTPANSDNTPILTLLVTILMAMSAVSVSVAILILYLHATSPTSYPPRWMKKIFFKYLGRILCVGNLSKQRRSLEEEGKTGKEMGQDEENQPMKTSAEAGGQDRPEELAKLGSILEKMSKIVQKIEDQDEENTRKDQWKDIARVIDRFFFWVGAVIGIITILGLFLDIAEHEMQNNN